VLIQEKIYCPNVLTISGTGRDVGKTTLACRIIEKMALKQQVIAVKISPHFHDVDYRESIIEIPGKYAVYKEDSAHRNKDSSRMLFAGADKVFYIQTKDDYLKDVWEALTDIHDIQIPVIIESEGILEVIDPGISLIVSHSLHNNKEIPNRKGTIKVVPGDKDYESLIGEISYYAGSWKIR
jgi:molybdopterin-guanine dinucleotide biosynthesis protein